MSGHEAQRLSAFLDGELAPAERRAVEAHLQACPDCQARLATLRGVDAAARELPAVAPPGYFDDFAARVRTRIEAAPARTAPPRAGGRWPLWAGAAAAALFLSIVMPRTLERAPRANGPDDLARSAVVPAAPSSSVASAPEPAPAEGLATQSAPARSARAADEAAGARSVAVPEKKEEERQAGAFLAPPLAPPPAAAGPRVAESEATGADAEGFAAAPPRDEPPPAEPVGEILDMRSRGRHDASSPRPKTRSPSPEAEAGKNKALEADRAPVAPAPPAASAESLGALAAAPDVEAAYRRLVASSPQGVEEWRERREEWRAFALAHSASPRVDEARVRVIEAGVAAWRAGGRDEDLVRAREDLAAYESRGDARLKDRARRAVESTEGR